MARRYPITLSCQECGDEFLGYDYRTRFCVSCRKVRTGIASAKRRGTKSGNFKHGETVGRKMSPEYNAYRGMVERCSNPKHIGYRYYGAVGVCVTPEWIGPGGFERFLAHAGRKPSPNHSIDRYPNKNGNYEPGNVRWATAQEQNLNRRSRKPYTHCRRGHPRTPENRVLNGTPTGACGPCRKLTG